MYLTLLMIDLREYFSISGKKMFSSLKGAFYCTFFVSLKDLFEKTPESALLCTFRQQIKMKYCILNISARCCTIMIGKTHYAY